MKRWMAYLLLCVSLIFAWNLTSKAATETMMQNYRQVWYDSSSGLDVTGMTCMLQDDLGYLWIGAQTGVVRFNGKTFERIGGSDSPKNVTCMLLQEDDEVWIGTQDDGIYVYQGQKFISHIQDDEVVPEGQSQQHITAMARNSEGLVYVGTDRGVFTVGTDGIIWWLNEKELLTAIRSLICLSDDSFCVLTENGNLYHCGSVIQTISIALDEGEELCSLSFHGTSEFYYVGTNKNHLYQISRMGVVNDMIETGQMQNIYDQYIDDLGRMWIASDDGVEYLQDNKIVYPQLREQGTVCRLFEDGEGNLWFLFSQKGLLKLSPSPIAQLMDDDSFEEEVTAVSEWKGLLWIGTKRGLYTWTEGDGVERQELEDWDEQVVQSLVVYEDALWIAGSQGLFVLQEDGTTKLWEEMPYAVECFAILEDTLWMGTKQGIWRYDGEKLEEYVSETELDEDVVTSLAVWEEKLYVGTKTQGLFVMDADSVTYLDQTLSSVIYAVQVNSQTGEVWALTDKGLVYGKENKWEYQTDLPDSFTNFVILSTGDVWMTSRSAVISSSVKKLAQERIEYNMYTRKTGLPYNLTDGAVPYLNQEGELFFSGQKGVLKIDTKQGMDLPAANVKISRVEIEGNLRFLEDGYVVIHNQQNVLELTISNVSYALNEFVPYCYLEGIDTKEVCLPDAKIRYTNLEGGTYVLHYGYYDAIHETYAEQGQIKIVKVYSLVENPYLRGGILLIIILIVFLIGIFLYQRLEKRLQRQYEIRHREEEESQLRMLAYQDYVTGCENRNSWKKRREEIDINEILLRSTGILVVSIDNIGQSNQLFGEDNEEIILKQFAQMLREIHGVMDEDIFYIRGGIFLILLSSQRDGNGILCQLREKAKMLQQDLPRKIYFSSGFAFFEANRDNNVDDILARSWEILEIERKKHEKERLADSIELS